MKLEMECFNRNCATCEHFNGHRTRKPGISTYCPEGRPIYGFVIYDGDYSGYCEKNHDSCGGGGNSCFDYEVWRRLHKEP